MLMLMSMLWLIFVDVVSGDYGDKEFIQVFFEFGIGMQALEDVLDIIVLL